MNIIAANKIINGHGNLDKTTEAINTMKRLGLRTRALKIAPLRMGWSTELPTGYLKCACAPLLAIIDAKTSFKEGTLDALIISGEDNIRTDFFKKKNERQQLMAVYGLERGFLDTYNQLTHAFLKRNNISISDFKILVEALYENYLGTWQTKNDQKHLPEDKWFEPVTDLFRGVDCANPNLDFSGTLILASDEAANVLQIPKEERITVLGCAVEQLGTDSVNSIKDIISYEHLRKAFDKASRESKLDFRHSFLNKKALLEVYTCYPVVPIAFLLMTGLVDSIHAVPSFLNQYPVTITGGLNLAKAPWNNTTLSTIIEMTNLLQTMESINIGGIHSICALGHLQGFLILAKGPVDR